MHDSAQDGTIALKPHEARQIGRVIQRQLDGIGMHHREYAERVGAGCSKRARNSN